ncbi:MAG: UpxY family transcription antiterminator [Bacteroidota bacterium]|nr:UpxY family transcription antiterminator [Bacteroidota bacterium]
MIQTRPRWEKKVARLLTQKGIETVCLLVKERRQWSDRIKTIEKPLLKSLLFVRIREEQRSSVRLTEGVVNFMSRNGKPVALTEKLVQQIRKFQQIHPEIEAIFDGVRPDSNGRLLQTETKNSVHTLEIETLNVTLVAGTLSPACSVVSTDKI